MSVEQQLSVEHQIKELEEQFTLLERMGQVNQVILEELTKGATPPADLGQARGFLRSAKDLFKHGDEETAEQLLLQAREASQPAQQWLAVGDLGISPFALRTHLQKGKPNVKLQLELIRYFLVKNPHAHNDRDKLDYLLSSYFAIEQNGEVQSRYAAPGELEEVVQDLSAANAPPVLAPPTEMMLHELGSLMANLADFIEFDQLANARIVERARTLKINLGEDFYHPKVLPWLIRFNIAFRRQFEALFREQLEGIRELTQARIDEAWNLIQQIEEAYEEVALPGAEPILRISDPVESQPPAALAWEAGEERVPLHRLRRSGEEPQEEQELKGIVGRIARFVAKLSVQDLQSEKVLFPLRRTQLELGAWGLEAFRANPDESPEAVRTLRGGLGLVAWMEEELALYQEKRGDRYLSKPHFDFLSYGVARSLNLLTNIRSLIRIDGTEAEAVWFRGLLQLALRLANTLNHLAPVFAEPSRP